MVHSLLHQMVSPTCHRKSLFIISDVTAHNNDIRFIRPPPPLTPFGIPLGGNPGGGGDHQNISGALMAQYLMALLGYHDPAMLGMPENGRMGDYVFNQEGLLRQTRSIVIFTPTMFLLSSTRSNNFSNYGKLECTPTSACVRRSYR